MHQENEPDIKRGWSRNKGGLEERHRVRYAITLLKLLPLFHFLAAKAWQLLNILLGDR